MDEGKCLMSGPGHRGRQESIPLVGYLGVWIFFLLWSETTGSLGLVFFFGGGGFLGFIFNNFIDIQVTEHVIKKKNTIQWFLAIHYIMQQSSKSILEHFHHFQKRHQTS